MPTSTKPEKEASLRALEPLVLVLGSSESREALWEHDEEAEAVLRKRLQTPIRYRNFSTSGLFACDHLLLVEPLGFEVPIPKIYQGHPGRFDLVAFKEGNYTASNMLKNFIKQHPTIIMTLLLQITIFQDSMDWNF